MFVLLEHTVGRILDVGQTSYVEWGYLLLFGTVREVLVIDLWDVVEQYLKTFVVRQFPKLDPLSIDSTTGRIAWVASPKVSLIELEILDGFAFLIVRQDVHGILTQAVTAVRDHDDGAWERRKLLVTSVST